MVKFGDEPYPVAVMKWSLRLLNGEEDFPGHGRDFARFMDSQRPDTQMGLVLDRLRRPEEKSFDVEFPIRGQMNKMVGRKLGMKNPAEEKAPEQRKR